ncbi:MAG: hypothetical protein H0X02_09560 [Nitrosomonas sp.]|nr:hypothetical protein [Nitrosomonas sp.]
MFEGAKQIGSNMPPNLEKMLDGDVEAWIDAVLFPPYIVANASSANDAIATFAIRRKVERAFNLSDNRSKAVLHLLE